METIGIINAGDSEVAPFLEKLRIIGTAEKAMLKFYECEYCGKRIVTLYTGVCKVNAAIATQLLIDMYSPDYIVNAGTCGGLDESVDIFDTVVATACVYHDVEMTNLTEFHPWLEKPFFEASELLLKKARLVKARTPIRFGTIATGEYFLKAEEQRKYLLENFPTVLAVDMESAAVAHTCYVNGIPFVSIRTVTDNGSAGGVETFEANVEKAAEISMEITLNLVENLKSEAKTHEKG